MRVRELTTRFAPRWVQEQLTRRSLWGGFPNGGVVGGGEGRQIALTFDLDYQADTDVLPGLLDVLDEFGVKTTLFGIGALVRQDPGGYERAAAEGHELGNHTETHPDNPVLNPDREFWDLGVNEMRDEIGRCQDTIEEFTGVRPVGFRTPHFKDAFRMMGVLEEFPEISYVSTALASKCPVPVPFFPSCEDLLGDLSLHYPSREGSRGCLMIPLSVSPKFRWSPFCTYSSIRRPSVPQKGAGLQSVGEWEEDWKTVLERDKELGFVSVYFDPLDVMRDQETVGAFRRMLGLALEEGWEIVPLREVDRTWRGMLV